MGRAIAALLRSGAPPSALGVTCFYRAQVPCRGAMAAAAVVAVAVRFASNSCCAHAAAGARSRGGPWAAAAAPPLPGTAPPQPAAPQPEVPVGSSSSPAQTVSNRNSSSNRRACPTWPSAPSSMSPHFTHTQPHGPARPAPFALSCAVRGWRMGSSCVDGNSSSRNGSRWAVSKPAQFSASRLGAGWATAAAAAAAWRAGGGGSMDTSFGA